MSTAYNHMKRSHYSAYRTRGFTGSRRAVGTPTIKKSGFNQLISSIRNFRKPKESKADKEA